MGCTSFGRAPTAFFCVALIGLGAPRAPAAADIADEALQERRPLEMSLSQALQLALIRSYVLNQRRLDYETAQQQVREAYGSVYPRLDANGNYTRQIDQLNPFAGTSGNEAFFNGGAVQSFLAQPADPGEPPDLALLRDQFVQFQNAQSPLDLSSNPFIVENRIILGLTLTQTLYDASAFAAIKGAKALKELQAQGVVEQARLVVRDVSRGYYDVLLAQARVEVLRRSEERSTAEVADARARVAQGTQPQFSLLTAEVQLANVSTERSRAERDAAAALDQLKLLIGIPVELSVELSDALDGTQVGSGPAALPDALAVAYEDRPDLKQADLQVQLNEVDEGITKAEYVPLIDAFFTAQMQGNVPDDRNFTTSQTLNDMRELEGEVTVVERGFFDSSFWGPNVSAGLRLTWNIFNGFQTTSRLRQREVATRRARVDRQLLRERVRAEVEAELRNLRIATEQIRNQEKNVDRAETNYAHANARVEEGVSSQVELRDASELLDDSRLNYLNALRDYLVAEVQYQVAIGQPPLPEDEVSLEIEEGHGGEKPR